MGRGKKWTKEEDLYLEEYWGVKSIGTLAKNLDRSTDAVMVRKTRLGLGRFLDNGEYITYSQLLQALYGLDSAGVAYRNFRRCRDFPIRKKRGGKKSYKVVYLQDFWQWAEEHKRLFDFSKMEEYALGAEPEWVKRKRKIDFMCRVNTNPWTPAEDQRLIRMLRFFRYTYTDIAVSLNRTEGAVKRRIYDLGIKERPIKAVNRPWMDEEVQILIFMYEEGYSFERIGHELGRSALACRGKMERIEHPEYTLRSYRYRKNREKK